jgi:translocation and assembly module TamB
VRSGAGVLQLEGRTPARPTADEPAIVRIHGERLKAANTPELDVEVSTDLEVEVTDKRVRAAGTISVPLAHVELIEVPPSAVGPSPDVTFTEAKRNRKPRLETQVDITLALGDDVTFRGFGAYAKLEGQLRVQQEGVHLPTGSGEMRVADGYYRAYGQNLVFEKGRLLFAGPVNNPGLDIRALRDAEDGTRAGVTIGGSAEQPAVTLFSEPTMNENNVLSYIMTGRPIEQGTSEDHAKVKGAAAMMGGNVMSTYLGSKVGLDEARIESGTGTNDASLVAGKYITPKIYAAYAMGLFNQGNLMRLRYLVSPRWAVQTETGRTMGADVLFSIERGKSATSPDTTAGESEAPAVTNRRRETR